MIRMVVILGALIGVGLTLIVTGLRRSPPRLDAVISRLNEDQSTAPAPVSSNSSAPWHWMTRRLSGAAFVPIPHQDLAILGMTPERFIAEKLGAAAFGLFLPLVLSALAAVQGLNLPWLLPTGSAAAFAVAGWFVPDGTIRSTAARRRADFRHALSAYFDFVRLAFGGGVGPTEALERAPRFSGGWAFQRIADAIEAAQYARLTPWHGLARLGKEIGVDELGDLADLADLAGNEGAKVADAITAYTQQMRSRRLSEMRYQAGSRTTTMTVPIATIGLAFITLIGFPQIYLLLNS
ncbi:type II secretion system F family protein [Actinomadura viridis]|uniref:type II secretion system F family protein n=1 Tax=Actinomadura viridis TaxID=58110 RepID=UPI0036AF01AB